MKIILFALLLAQTCLGQTQTCAPTPPGLVGWWPADGNGLDAVGNQDAVLENGLSFAAGEVSQAFLFNTTNADIHVAASSVLNVGTGSGFTLETWINPTDVSQARPLFEWNNGTSWGVHFHIASGQAFNVNPGPGELYANIVDDTGRWHQLSSPGGTVLTNVFQHVALTYDHAAGVATLYWNGLIVGQKTLGTFTPQTSWDLYLGRRVAPSTDAGSFAGLMDEPSIYNRGLSQSEIQAIYNAGSYGKCGYESSLSIGLYAGLSITGTVGQTFQIEYATSLSSTNWIYLANVTLSQPVQLWVDTSAKVRGELARFYRMIPAP
jgi:hypothetical protein